MQKFYRRILIVMGLTACLLVGAAAVQVRCLEGPAADAREETEARTAEPALTGEPAVPEPEETLQEEAVTAEPETPMASEHFGLWEYACDCAGYCSGFPAMPDPELTVRVEALRCACGRPVILTSGVRCGPRNEEVGGVSWSFHKRGRAADLYCPGVGVGDLAALAKGVGLNVLPYYSSGYVHVELVE
ncbi:Peptidase M15 [Eubacterium maltosivorans]|uniref:YcbK family protein n=1 Tax=Eubacterium maltosivorans TaxID=2041044 RepID=UPI0008854DA0|nr:D-Ala-D-Ala carboxypeptidase family metallohydrolase [Eubacterium maltosivorans]WPK81295.1 hypothetical protein EUMA32_27250 [Eubacterium maltosivorans]SDO62162.1 Peptidase M15 [Eubacterium maltosivorans]